MHAAAPLRLMFLLYTNAVSAPIIVEAGATGANVAKIAAIALHTTL